MATRPLTFDLSKCVVLDIHPNEIHVGDRIATVFTGGRAVKYSDPVSEYEVNPRGCLGHTHVNKQGCYDNIATITVARSATKHANYIERKELVDA